MSQIYNVRNGGNGKITFGMKKVNSYTVDPLSYIATPAGLTIANDRWLNFDYFNLNQTSASTDAVFLPTSVGTSAAGQFFPAGSQGAEFRIFAITAMKVLPPVDGLSTINAGTNVQGISLSAGALGIFTCTKASGAGLIWVCSMIVPSGVISSPVPA